MAGTHNVSSAAISIIRIAEIANDDVVHPTIKQFTADGLKFPITKQLIRPAHPSQKKIFSKKRPTVCGF
jgi:hypothetical protein